MIQQTVTVKNKTGLHARPAALFVQAANKFKSEIFIEKEGKKVNAKSIMGVMSLAVSQGTQITISAEGEDEKEAVEKLVELIESKFGEE
ncbi:MULTISPECIES: HPr family phosphocarrier protein [Tepidanaerobacter]|uniref:Phosphocarrier protein HPr n=1 Tax=Tepidanaerobacter syntrophicus TaxID=224999 RepID=A0A0U9HEZ2_9FIRM|nr:MULTISPECIES: HPr family phosphocarrier protein [Tepidanaerobacter]GAQ24452.1 phosphocarrier protein [Tepidanaerobacter syntrophicus]GLI18250.1 HPr-like protein Crh [Tepidanaerobacter syntrophicus]GLI52023.1 HPr-like protein Crh [Tepidanaerobacter syntrophicus]HHV82570.1 HPr family phosphocarrier protein [Tepidanaerobacter syntrophicus]